MFEGMSDDQIALLGCAVAFFFCMGLMIVSHSLRQIVRKDAVEDAPRPAALELEPRISAVERSDRKAA